MRRFKNLITSIYKDFRLPWQLVIGLVIFYIVGAAVISAVAIGLTWLMCTAIGKEFVLNDALQPGVVLLGAVLLLLALWVGVIIHYVRQKWKDTNDKP